MRTGKRGRESARARTEPQRERERNGEREGEKLPPPKNPKLNQSGREPGDAQ